MADNNDKNKLRRKRVSSTNSSRSGQARSNREENKSKVRIKKQAGSGDSYYEESSNIVDFNSRRNRNTDRYIKDRDRDYYTRNKRPSYNEDDYDDYDDYDDEYYDYEEDGPSRLKRILKKLLLVVLVISIIGGSAGFLYVRSVVSDMPVLTKKMVNESYINKEPVALARIPANLQKAVVAIEDHRFYDHKGIDYKSFVRSIVNNLTGGATQGASTIDMQVSKNLLTSNEKTLKRKIQDMHNARELNKIMTKDEILEAYLNNMYLGKSAYGVQAGAHLYFGKDVSNLTFGECTMLAGITNNPSLYQNYEQAKKRQAAVLLRMYKLGYIKENVYKAQMYRDTPFKSEIDQ
ncbi:transglycosylase domain-containing protein [Peptostreptococcus stomatis]|uniref:transglycosylase domain-containing protein n=1 Tax=Peptostreptococcus stomatis TaxID=341694 RepID=UPI003FA06551